MVVVEGEGLSEFNVFHIRIKSMYLRTAYSLALEKLGVVVPMNGMNMRSTKIEAHDNYLGPFHEPDDPWMFEVGQTLRHIYPKDGEDIGDHLVLEREQKKNDTVVKIPTHKRRKRPKYTYELITELMDTDTWKQEGRNKLEKMKLSMLQ